MNPRPCYGIKFLRLFGVEAIVLFPWMLFAGSKESVSPVLFRHELEHVRQVQRVGVFAFYRSYLGHYFKARLRGESHWNAYALNPYEIEARAAEGEPMTREESALWAVPGIFRG